MFHEGMILTDFVIAKSFYTATGEWIVKDIGTHTIIAIKKEDIDSIFDDGDKDIIFYDYEFGGCSLKSFKGRKV